MRAVLHAQTRSRSMHACTLPARHPRMRWCCSQCTPQSHAGHDTGSRRKRSMQAVMVQRLAGTMRPPRLLHSTWRARATMQLAMLHDTTALSSQARLRACAARHIVDNGGRGGVQRRRSSHQTGPLRPSTALRFGKFCFGVPQGAACSCTAKLPISSRSYSCTGPNGGVS